MASSANKSTSMAVRDTKSGRFVTVKGAGALKGKMVISKTVDLTKPIVGRPVKGKWTPKGNLLPSQIARKGNATHSGDTQN